MTMVNPSIPLPDPKGLDILHDRLVGLQRHRWKRQILILSLLSMGLLAGVLTLVSFLGYWDAQPPAALRYIAFALCLGAVMLVFVALFRGLFWRPDAKRTARFLESALPELRNDLINPLLLAGDDQQVSPVMIQRVIDESVRHIGPVDFRKAIPAAPLRRAMIWATAGVAMLALFASLQVDIFQRGLWAALLPDGFVPAHNDIELIELTPGDTTILPAEPVLFRLAVKNTAENDLQAFLHLPGEANPRPMFIESAGRQQVRFALELESVHENTPYYLKVSGQAGSSRFPVDRPTYLIRVRPLKLEKVAAHYTYPRYTGLPQLREELSLKKALLKAPMGSTATLEVHFDQPVARGVAEFETGRQEPTTPIEAGRVQRLNLDFLKDDAVQLTFFDTNGRIVKRLPNGKDGQGDRRISILAMPDQPPTIRFTQPNRNLTWPLGTPVPLSLFASDDFGLASVKLYAGLAGQTASLVKLTPATQPRSGKTRRFGATLPTKGYQPGQVLVYYATAMDNRFVPKQSQPQQSVTPKFTLTLKTPQQSRAEAQRQADVLQKTLLAMLEHQLRQRVDTAVARNSKTLRHLHRRSRGLESGQTKIRDDLQRLVKTFTWTPATDDIRTALSLLHTNEATLAVQQAQVLVKLGELERVNTSALLLADTQTAIIGVLQDILAVLPATLKNSVAKTNEQGTDLSDDQRKEIKKQLQDDLKKFLEEQKKVIAATERLNKKPLDDFTPADMKLLKELAATQDKWEKFLNEKFTDFSKLDAQDFSNPSMLKELLAVKCDVTMAKDALKKKATEIAVAAEGSAMENAETLTANIEKWLPDKPDREKWSMEAPEDQRNVELAELSGELEDLVGDLLEDEEDLFEEMDDLSAKAAMSGDKGIGWDAADGPISNMNAQGVTGNQLPNTSEISGRSGEGRTGKSAGEFVEDKAVGKGGRRTPTRMGDEPFQKGEVNDVSTDPPGGATGGGKHSGSGEAGLEGAAPADVQRKLKLLAGKQAKLVNRAEKIQTKFQAGSYGAFKLNQAVLLMNRVQADLEKGQYHNAMRRRRGTLKAISQTREMLNAKLKVEQDKTGEMPKYLREGIRNSQNQPLPEEYRELLQRYYQRINE